MPGYNPYEQQNNDIISAYSNVDNKGFFSRMLRRLTTYGMSYNDMIARNTVAVGENEDPMTVGGSGSVYDILQQKAMNDVLSKKSIAYIDRSYSDKRRLLREYSIRDEIRDFIDTVADECIVYDDDRDFCEIRPLSTEYSDEIRKRYQEIFELIYASYGFNNSATAFSYMKDFLIDGYLAFEIIFDDKKKNIIGFNKLAAETLVPSYEINVGQIWIQYPDDPNIRRILLDSQIIFISYGNQKNYGETSYVEGLIKPYNQLKILEETRLMYNIVNASVYQKFTVPTKNLGIAKAKQKVGEIISNYKDEVSFDERLGTIMINGEPHLPYNKQYWFNEDNSGKIEMEMIKPEGHDLNESEILKWFRNILQRASRIPIQRFSDENGGGTVIDEASEITRDEVKFSNFINRLRMIFKEIIVKPIRVQMLMDFPEYIEDNLFINNIDIVFNSNQLFEEWKKISNISKRVDFVDKMLSLQGADDKPYFNMDYVIEKYLKLSPEEIEENKKYWAKSNGASGSVQGNTPQEEGGFGGGESQGGGEEFGGSEPMESSEPESQAQSGGNEEGGFSF